MKLVKNVHEVVDLARVVIASCLMVFSGWMVITNVFGWGWFLFVAIVIFPTQINIDFREGKDEQHN